ncbi:S41 family peptidase [Rhizobium tropici]|uniref:Peptidase S41 n=1 Tax=Rhizobium tropici TaxID=398 RepID=A0A329Y7M1_RHITR|nr:S41 family peptidase [Rhizobium tropici]RAX37922.1 peptidase S41 [Rhizobium tropici]
MIEGSGDETCTTAGVETRQALRFNIRRVRRVTGLIALWPIAAGFSVGALAFAPFGNDVPNRPVHEAITDRTHTYRQLALFGLILEQVRAQYVTAPSEPDLIRAATEGMFLALDVHSSYLPPARFADLLRQDSGQFGGVGIEAEVNNGIVKVIASVDDSPAERAGIMAGDLVVEVDGRSTVGKTMDEIGAMFLGAVGSDVEITIVRDTVANPIQFSLKRETIKLGAPRLSFERTVPVVRLSSFSDRSSRELAKLIRSLVADAKPAGVILDLRSNIGGPLEQAAQIADAFLAGGAIFYTRGRGEGRIRRYDAVPDDIDALLASVPVIVLVNGGTASAAEVVSGALQDHRRATLVGTRTFGKGVAQNVIVLGQESGMTLTTARIYTPSNRSIQALGIMPDIEIVQTVPATFKGKVSIPGEAGLARHLPGEQGEATFTSLIYVPGNHREDNQLQYAVDLVLGIVHREAFPADPQRFHPANK